MAEMVWCQSCGDVIWAFDHQTPVDMRGIANMFDLPCPNCNRQKVFDGWGAKELDEKLVNHAKASGVVIFDMWSAMKFIAKIKNKNWNPSPNNTWQIGAYQGLRNSIARWRIEKTETQDELKLAKLDGKIEAYEWLIGKVEVK